MNNQFNNRSYNVSITDVYKISLTLLQALKSYPLFWNNSVVIGRSSSMWPTYISVYEQNETKTTLPKWYIYVTSLVREGIKCRRAILWLPQLRTLAG